MATALLAAGVFLLFGWLTQRHVGHSYFLADQVDQLQNYEALLRFEPRGLLGGGMSGTEAHALGPLGALIFGLPVTLGLGVDAIHALTSLLLAVTAAVTFFELAQVNAAFAWTWLLVLTAMPITWWNAGILWSNTLLLPIGLLMLAVTARGLRRPSATAPLLLLLLLTLALQLHLIAVVAIPLLAGVAFASRRQFHSVGARPVVVVAVLVLAGLTPYAIAEARTGARNTRAMFAHVDAAVHSDRSAGRTAAVDTLVQASDPDDLLPRSRPRIVLLAGGLMAVLALAASRLTPGLDPELCWLVAAAVGSIAWQALFFLAMARPLNGFHYVTLLAPLYPIPFAAVIAAATSALDRRTHGMLATSLGIVTLVLLATRGTLLADRYAESTAWTYRGIVSALDTLCGGETARTIEGPGLADDMNPDYDGVLAYLMKRGFSRCGYDAASDLLIADNRDGREFQQTRDVNGESFMREAVAAPGLARYRRIR
jgi:hypothetical protein